VRIANGQLWMRLISKGLSSGRESGPRDAQRSGIRPTEDDRLTIAALHQGNYATISNYLERELRYMDAGE
jgi:hypothetical protein